MHVAKYVLGVKTTPAAVFDEHGLKQLFLIGSPIVRKVTAQLTARLGNPHVVELDRFNGCLNEVRQQRRPIEAKFLHSYFVVHEQVLDWPVPRRVLAIEQLEVDSWLH